MKRYNVAVVGATGVVGQTFLRILEQREFPIASIRLLASERSKGKKLNFRNEEITVDVLTEDSFSDMDFALFSAGAKTSQTFSPIAAKAGVTVIDNSSAFRMEPNVPLIVPEVNSHAVSKEHKIIANPNCSTIQMVVAVKPLHEAAGLKRIVVSTYQAVSGAGSKAVNDLLDQSRRYLENKDIIDISQIAFNVRPEIDVFLDDGYTKEELKMMKETRKIMELPSLPVSATCVRVPVVTGHSVSVNLEFERELKSKEAKEILEAASGVTVMDDPAARLFPTPLDAAGKDDVFVGRIREDASVQHGLNMWVVSDNLRKGAALNAVQIAELLI